jgi:hypothetical protein
LLASIEPCSSIKPSGGKIVGRLVRRSLNDGRKPWFTGWLLDTGIRSPRLRRPFRLSLEYPPKNPAICADGIFRTRVERQELARTPCRTHVNVDKNNVTLLDDTVIMPLLFFPTGQFLGVRGKKS